MKKIEIATCKKDVVDIYNRWKELGGRADGLFNYTRAGIEDDYNACWRLGYPRFYKFNETDGTYLGRYSPNLCGEL